MSWNTKITKLLNIDYPIIQGAMAYISDGVLAAAMSHAGCAGVIGSGGFTPDEVQSHIRRFKDIAGSQKVYGVNLMLQDDNKDDIAQIICDEKVPFVTIGAGNPIPWFEPFHQKGIKCIPVVPNVKLAQRVQAHGADALVVEGMEAGGHDGKLTLMALLENVLPVLPTDGVSPHRFLWAHPESRWVHVSSWLKNAVSTRKRRMLSWQQRIRILLLQDLPPATV